MLTILQALDGPFADFFAGDSWDAWRAFLAGLYGLDMTSAELATWRRCTGRSDAPTQPATEAFVVCGRRSGKSRIASAVAAYAAALADTSTLAPGEVGVVLVTAVDKTQAGVVLSYVKALFDGVPALRPLVVEETAESLTLRHGVRVEVRSSNFRSVRGTTVLCAVLDECAFMRDESSALPDLELYRALKSALATTHGLLLAISSPWAQRGLLWSKYKRHYAQDGPVLVWQAPSTVMHPGLDAELIAEALADDPEAASAEWSATFRSDLESYLSVQALDAVTTPGVVERPPVAGVRYVSFADVAAGSGRDSYAVAIAHAAPRPDGEPFVVLDCVREALPPFDPISVTQEMAALLKRYRVAQAQADRFAGAWVTQSFSRHGVQVAQDAEPKSTIYLSALPLFTGRRVDMLDIPKLRAQLAGLERRRRAGGRDAVDHLPGAHDDLANAAAGALTLAAARATGDGEVLAANVAPEPRGRVLDVREFELLGRGLY